MDEYKQIEETRVLSGPNLRKLPKNRFADIHKTYAKIAKTGPPDPTNGRGWYNDAGAIDECAYVTLMFGGDAYTQGCVVLAQSLQHTAYHKVCMVTNDVSANAREILIASGWDEIIEVPYIECKNIQSSISKSRYSWISKSLTKFNMMNLVKYKKVLFLEPDMIIVHSIDHLFEMPTPSGMFSSFSSYPRDTRTISPYWTLKHGDYVQPWMIPEAFHNYGHGPIGAPLIIKPDKQLFDKLVYEIANRKVFGYTKPYSSGIDEITFAWFYSIVCKIPMYHIHEKYGWVPWKHPRVDDVEWDKPYANHFFGVDKPWLCTRDKYNDDYWVHWWDTLTEWVSTQSNPNMFNETNEGGIIFIGGRTNSFKYGHRRDIDAIMSVVDPGVHVDIVEIVNTSTHTQRVYDIKIILEMYRGAMDAVNAKHTIFIPNIEAMTDWNYKLVKRTGVITLCKTQLTYDELRRVSPNSGLHNTGFTTIISETHVAKNRNLVVHLGNGSYMKGTYAVLQTWVNNKCFLNVRKKCRLIITFNQRIITPDVTRFLKLWKSLKPVAVNTINAQTVVNATAWSNVTVVDYLPPELHDEIRNSAGYHLCPSYIEGFGHYINQVRALSSYLITTNGQPMNSFISDPNHLIEVETQCNIHKDFKHPYAAPTKIKSQHVSLKSFGEKIERALIISNDQYRVECQQSRLEYTSDRNKFTETVSKIMSPMIATINK